MDYLVPKIGRLAECICDDGVRRVDNFMKLSTSIKTLRDKKIRGLVARENDIRAKLEIEEKQGKQPLEEVTLWLTRVVEVKPKVEASITTYEQRGDDNCFVRLRQLLDLAETVGEELNKEVDELLGKEFKDGLVIEQLPPAEANMLNSLPSLLNQSKTKEKLVVEMMRLLKDSKVGKLGAYGMEGMWSHRVLEVKMRRSQVSDEQSQHLFRDVDSVSPKPAVWVWVVGECDLRERRLGMGAWGEWGMSE
ncbi:hypothetical protein Sjap_025512 [Stephania japonica]|uniref:Uncharacterized protein n=1 Tax=Stephania japonica TaxID=461633 RepID=A0AAP0E1Y6_9MAGN